MSNSYHTEKVSSLANVRMKHDRDGYFIYPRVIGRRPSPGEIHPLPPWKIRNLFRLIPIEYIYGLKHVELRPRLSKDIGRPFGCYLPSDKVIWLYSLPTIWRMKQANQCLRKGAEEFGATVSNVDNHVEINWSASDTARLDLWFCAHVLTHELGHHFVEQYKNKRGRNMRRSHHEFVAEIHSQRIWAKLQKL